MLRPLPSLLPRLAFTALAAASGAAHGEDAGVAAALAAIRPDALRAHVEFLADDLLEGRGTGTRGHELAARYVAAQLRALGFEPAAGNGTYFQPVPLEKRTLAGTKCALRLTGARGSAEFVFETDFLLRAIGDRDDAAIEAPLVFAGFGVTAAALGRDDYAGLDLAGKIAVILSGAPASFASAERAHHSSTRVKLETAAAHGARGVIQILRPEEAKLFPWPARVRGSHQGFLSWIDTEGTPHGIAPALAGVATLNPAASERLFALAGRSLADALAATEKPGGTPGFALGVSARIATASRASHLMSQNVIGRLAGSDPALAAENVVYTAHLDHLGIGEPLAGDSIYNGALDDGSGVAGVLEVARAFASLAPRAKRSLLVVIVTAEEAGLVGSDYFVHHPPVPIASLVADVNLDGISMLFPPADVVALGAEHSSLAEPVAEAAKRMGLGLSPDPSPEQVYFVRSDQYSFVRAGIPSVFPDAGLKSSDPAIDGEKLTASWNETIYHTPKDDARQPLDYEGGAKITRFDFLIGYLVAQAPARPIWNAGDFFGTTFAPKPGGSR
ncbi:MAG: M28 family metallopeptidase [Thermoanaerobaculia bacterium]